MLELKFLLENVGDSYPDFVSGVLVSTKGNNAKQEQVADFIDGNPGVTSSEIIEYLDALEEKEKELFCLIDGIPGMYDDLKNVVLRYARRNAGNLEGITAFLKENPETDKSKLMGFICESDGLIPGGQS